MTRNRAAPPPLMQLMITIVILMVLTMLPAKKASALKWYSPPDAAICICPSPPEAGQAISDLIWAESSIGQIENYYTKKPLEAIMSMARAPGAINTFDPVAERSGSDPQLLYTYENMSAGRHERDRSIPSELIAEVFQARYRPALERCTGPVAEIWIGPMLPATLTRTRPELTLRC